MCYHAQFGRASLKRVVIDRGKSQKLEGRWDSATLVYGAVADPLKSSPLLHMCYRVKFGSSASKESAGPRPLANEAWLTGHRVLSKLKRSIIFKGVHILSFFFALAFTCYIQVFQFLVKTETQIRQEKRFI